MTAQFKRLQLDLLRHGEVSGVRGFCGSTDAPLSASGWQAMRTAIPPKPSWSRIYATPLQRTLSFARSLGEELGVPVTIVPEFRATDFGAWEKQTHSMLRASMPERLAQYLVDPIRFRPPGGESALDVAARAGPAFAAILDQCSDREALLVAHSNVILSIVAMTLNLAPQQWGGIAVPHACRIRIHFQEGRTGWRGVIAGIWPPPEGLPEKAREASAQPQPLLTDESCRA